MRSHVARWVVFVGGLVAYDIQCARNDVEGDSFSEVTRSTFRVDTPAGGVAFLAAWAALTAWFLPHILRTPRSPERTKH